MKQICHVFLFRFVITKILLLVYNIFFSFSELSTPFSPIPTVQESGKSILSSALTDTSFLLEDMSSLFKDFRVCFFNF